jgi:hypothetical protein
MSFLFFIIRRPVDYSEHENWRITIRVVTATNKTPDHTAAQANSRPPHKFLPRQ